MKLRVQRQKLSDIAAEEVKRWIMAARLSAGDRLPPERELMERLGVSKGTVREALKSLEVQGVITISAGANGGASVAEVGYERTAELLGNYFFFQQLDAQKIYEFRCLAEPKMAALAVGHLTEEHFRRLERSIHACSHEPEKPEARRLQRIEELNFHSILAEACPNPLLSFTCRFINKLLADLVVFKKMYQLKQKRIAQTNHTAHLKLLEAYRQGDVNAVRDLMHAHMLECADHIVELEAVVESRFLNDFSNRPITDLSR